MLKTLLGEKIKDANSLILMIVILPSFVQEPNLIVIGKGILLGNAMPILLQAHVKQSNIILILYAQIKTLN
jgi:hypothetical protein